ncbi:hypothetical protein AGABI1DRAFT_120269 [Agaricus bisporus var. burnettii JB137-S8]|uniref:EF-hand domain-containing protein n=1 Tax=Agaricus bisporus var. burnettii (strain JB137-S8 / ATCC MYA-4627 / FGSC 10392) TaxID=597362 RepID=K5XB05_AGABU|nr:uncharacterized protein AGABI1DRAFT_120269 [Agaricus bisporus var. burnettii JB137-S8]EKM80242.1 hypothetical protein AGABI1DRAFT_120269 [Agaricus bisporus var. burnettii JB137-S8]
MSDGKPTHDTPNLSNAQSLAARRDEDFFATGQDELASGSEASPPYRTLASSSNLRLPIHPSSDPPTLSQYPSSPPYKSSSRVNLLEESSMMEKTDYRRLATGKEKSFAEDEKPKPSVHYPPNVVQKQDSYDYSATPSIAGTDDEDDEDYDWSGEEDLDDEEAKFEKQMGIKSKPEGWSFIRILSLLFSTLLGSMFMAGILVIPPLIVHFYWYEPHKSDFRHYVNDNVQAWFFWAAANLIISWWLALIIDLVPVVARFIIAAAWGHVSEYVKNRIEMYNSVKDNIKPAFYAASAWASWIIIFAGIYKLFDNDDPQNSRAGYTYRLSQVVEFMFFFALVICASRMLSHAIAFNFHRTAYKERIASLEEALSVVEKLRDYRPPRPKSGTRSPIFGLKSSDLSSSEHAKRLNLALKSAGLPRSSNGHADDGNDGDTSDGDRDATLVNQKKKRQHRKSGIDLGRKGNPIEVSFVQPQTTSNSGFEDIELRPHVPSVPPSRPTTPSHLNPHRYPPQAQFEGERSRRTSEDGGLFGSAAKALKNAVMHDARNITRTSEDDMVEMKWNVSSASEAKRLARSIYMRFKDRHRRYLIPSDFYPAFPDEDTAKQAFRVFDKNDNGDISRSEIKTKLLKVYKERRFLSRSMRDVGEALATLHRIILFFAAVILFFISLSVFGVEVGDSLTSVYSIGIAASFIFKSSASRAFDAIMFLFVTHPYDTGDRCFIDQENLVVKRVNLFATVFARADGTETYYFNSQLFAKFITNVRRSGNTFETVTMQVAWRTPLEKLDALEKCLNDWLETEENRWYEPSTNVTPQHIVYQRYLELTIGLTHNGNWQDWGLRNTRRTAFHAAVQYFSRQLGIIGYEAPLPIVYSDSLTANSAKDWNPTMGPMFGGSTKIEDKTPFTQREAEVKATRNTKSLLGFVPPLANRGLTLSRSRKSKSRKAGLRGTEG